MRNSPMGAPRQTRADRWKQRPVVLRYHAYRDELREMFPEPLGDKLHVKFHIPMPKSWSQKKKAAMAGTPCQSKPDIDNLIKGVLDALLAEDKSVWFIVAEKYWSVEPSITIGKPLD